MQERAVNQPDPRVVDLDLLRNSKGDDSVFWPAFLDALSVLAGARAAALLTRSTDGWKRNCVTPANSQYFAELPPAHAHTLADAALREGGAISSAAPVQSDVPGNFLIATRLVTAEANRPGVMLFALQSITPTSAANTLSQMQALADTPLAHRFARVSIDARVESQQFANVLDLLALLNAQTRFLAAVFALCNGLAAKFRCTRVDLGWLRGSYIRLEATSHSEQFERKMEVVRLLETAMEEALDQDSEIAWPLPESSTLIAHDHGKFATAQSVPHLLSLPLRLDGKTVGVLMLERSDLAFTDSEIRELRLLCDLAVRRLAELQQHDRWFGARFATAARVHCSSLLGPEHTWAKLAAIGAAITLAVLVLGTRTYRVDAPFTLRASALAQLSAPFDGFLADVKARPGDAVDVDQELLALDTRQLLLEEGAALAEQQRYLSEAQKHESERNPAEMQIALAMVEQAKARLGLVRHRLTQAAVRAPFKGFVIEGDLREKIAAPVHQGDLLFKVARLDQMYLEIEVSERDIQEIHEGASGEVAFASRPQIAYPLRIERIEPAAEVKDGKNTFVVRCSFTQSPEPWWRPGMSGVAKVDAGKRSLFWIFTHRTVEFLRLKLWW